MNFLVISRTKTIKEAIVGSFMPMGVDIFCAEGYEEGEKLLFARPYGMVFLDFDVGNDLDEGVEFVREALEDRPDDPPTIVVVSSRANRQLVEDLIERRVRAFLVKPLEEQQIIKRLVDIKKRFHYVDLDKKYYRVTPPAGSPIPIYVRSPRNAKLIKGQVRNISLGGASFITGEKIGDDELTEGDNIDKILLKLGAEDVELGGRLLYKLDMVCAVTFRQYTNQNLRVLSNFIFNQIVK